MSSLASPATVKLCSCPPQLYFLNSLTSYSHSSTPTPFTPETWASRAFLLRSVFWSLRPAQTFSVLQRAPSPSLLGMVFHIGMVFHAHLSHWTAEWWARGHRILKYSPILGTYNPLILLPVENIISLGVHYFLSIYHYPKCFNTLQLVPGSPHSSSSWAAWPIQLLNTSLWT